MDQASMSGSKLASQLGMSVGYVSELRRGKKDHPGTDVVKKLAEILNVSPAWLLTGESGQRDNPATPLREDETDYKPARRDPKVIAVRFAHRLLSGKARDFYAALESGEVEVARKLAEEIVEITSLIVELVECVEAIKPST